MYDCPLPSEQQTNLVLQAIEDHTPKQDGEMSLIKGDLISDVKLLNNQWGIGRNYRGFVGLFPLRCVVEVDDDGNNTSSHRLPVDSLLSEIGQMCHNDDAVTRSSKTNTPVRLEMIESVEIDDQLESNVDEQVVRFNRNVNNNFQHDSETSAEFQEEQKYKYKTKHDDECENTATNQTKESSKFFSKPKMLVKPRPGKANKLFSKVGSSSSLRHSLQSNKDITKINATFPVKGCPATNQIWKPRQSLEHDQTSTQPISQTKLDCCCKHPIGPSHTASHPSMPQAPHQHRSNLELYENVTARTHDPQNMNENMRGAMYTRVNKKPLIKPRSMQTLNNTSSSFAADSVYSEPDSSRALLTNSLTKQNIPRAPRRTQRRISFVRVAGCAMTSLVLAVFVSLLMYFVLEYELLYVFITFCILSTICFVLLLISRLLRCILATLVPSLATLDGNIFLIILMWTSLILGPIMHIENNLTATIDSMSCLMEKSFNQTNAFMRPYDAVMSQMNKTVVHLESSAQSVMKGLLPLDKGLARVEIEVKTGRTKLFSTKKTCLNQMSRANEACERGLSQAYKQCQSVLGQIGVVYQQAKAALDSLDPNKWGQTSGRYKREENSRSTSINTRDNQLICKHLNEPAICRNHSDPEDTCHPSSWAGDAIQEAINETQSALNQLIHSLQFHITDVPYFETRSKTIKESINFNRRIMSIYQTHLYYFSLAISLIVKLSPISILIVFGAAYKYIKRYVVDDKCDNCYLDKDFDGIDHMISGITNRPLLMPFRDHEKIYISNRLQYERPRKSYSQFCIFVLNSIAVAVIYYLCYRHVYALKLLNEGYRVKQMDGMDSLEMVVVGDGVFVDLIDTFLKNMHPSKIWNNNISDATHCFPKLQNISFTILAIILTLNAFLILLIIIKRPLLKWRQKTVSYFYRERHQSRLIWLHDHMNFRRSLYPEIIYEAVRSKYRKVIMRNKISYFHSCLANVKSTCKARRCLVCDTKETSQSYNCTTEQCIGIYCVSCYRDMRETCPLCHFETVR